ncbi:MAG: Smr/MutS family protein, partial [bacterium]
GKTVAMKTTGLMVLMARMGLHIPASADSEIGVMGNVFVDIGDQQSIENDLSTFSSHTAKLREMIEKAVENDLILIDEMGSGTDPEEGTALALAVLQNFLKNGARCIATTHHGALKAFAHETEGVENGSMIFDKETLQPTYRFRPGIPGSSYAFEIAARMGLQKDVIADARKMVGNEKSKVENLISDLGNKIQQQEQMIQELKLEETRLTGLAKLYKERADALAANERKLKQQAVEESEAIIARANATIEEAIRTIREGRASKEAIRAAKQKIEAEKLALEQQKRKLSVKPQVKESPDSQPAAKTEIVPGAQLLWKKQNSRALVLDKPDADNRVHIQVGSLRLRVSADELALIAQDQRQNTGRISVFKPDDVSQEIDLRGMRAEEAIATVDSYLSDALLYGWDRVRIIHGKGTGALRKAVTDFLNTHPNVALSTIAAIGQGDFGVTEVELK